MKIVFSIKLGYFLDGLEWLVLFIIHNTLRNQLKASLVFKIL